MLVGDALKNLALSSPQQPAIISVQKDYNYKELYDEAAGVANELLNRGVKKGDRVGLLTRKSPETIVIYLGLSLSGIIGVPLSFHYRKNRLKQVLEMTAPKIIFIDAEFIDLMKGAAEWIDSNKWIIIGNSRENSLTNWNDFLKDSGKSAPLIEINEDDVFYLNFTSGSTGHPKAVGTTHSHIHWNTLSAIEALNIKPLDKLLCMFAVFSHPHEIFARPLWVGGTMVLLDSLYPKSLAKMISEHKVTSIMGLSPMYEMLIPFVSTGHYDFSELRLAESGGMKTSLSLQERFQQSIGIPIKPVWGSTETTGVAIATPADVGISLSCGKVAPYYNVKIIDGKGSEVSTGETGELVFQGPAVVNKYYNTPNETEKHFQDGWFHTGDMVYQDDEGLVYFRGRENGMMKVGGLKVFPREIEDTILQLPQVEEAAVITAYDKVRGEIPQAIVALKEGEILSKKQIKEHCRKFLANYMIPKKIDFRESLPKTPTGKIARKTLQEEIQTGTEPSKIEQLALKMEKIDLKMLQLLNERTRAYLKIRELQRNDSHPLYQPGQQEDELKKILGFNSGPLHDEFIEQFFTELFNYLMRF